MGVTAGTVSLLDIRPWLQCRKCQCSQRATFPRHWQFEILKMRRSADGPSIALEVGKRSKCWIASRLMCGGMNHDENRNCLAKSGTCETESEKAESRGKQRSHVVCRTGICRTRMSQLLDNDLRFRSSGRRTRRLILACGAIGQARAPVVTAILTYYSVSARPNNPSNTRLPLSSSIVK